MSSEYKHNVERIIERMKRSPVQDISRLGEVLAGICQTCDERCPGIHICPKTVAPDKGEASAD